MQSIASGKSSKNKLAALLSIFSVFLVIIVYVWFVSYGQWTHWKTNTTWYDQLAISFEHGQLSLQVTPSPALLALHDPYDPVERKPLGYNNYIGDLSLYQGKYYLYFGPAPVIIDLALKLLTIKCNWRPISNIYICYWDIDTSVTTPHKIRATFLSRRASLAYADVHILCRIGVSVDMDAERGQCIYFGNCQRPVLFSSRVIYHP